MRLSRLAAGLSAALLPHWPTTLRRSRTSFKKPKRSRRSPNERTDDPVREDPGRSQLARRAGRLADRRRPAARDPRARSLPRERGRHWARARQAASRRSRAIGGVRTGQRHDAVDSPADGAQIIVPYNLRYIATQADTIVTIAQKFTGEKEKAWVLDQYNHMKGQPVRRGDVVLIPLTNLPLTEAGKGRDRSGRTPRCAAKRRGRHATRSARSKPRCRCCSETFAAGAMSTPSRARGKLLALGELTRPQLASCTVR